MSPKVVRMDPPKVLTPHGLDTILPGALDPQPCALCGAPVFSEFQQESSLEVYGKIYCVSCEFVRWGIKKESKGGRL